MKKVIIYITLLLLATSTERTSAQADKAQSEVVPSQARTTIDREAIHPRYRQWATPVAGAVSTTNPAVLLWPVKDKKEQYRVRLSQDATLPVGATIESKLLDWAEYTPHATMANGRWYWQLERITQNGKTLSPIYEFEINPCSRPFSTPTIDSFLSMVSAHHHPRLYVNSTQMDSFRQQAKSNPETKWAISRANRSLNLELIAEAPTRPRDTTGLSEFETAVMMRFMYHKFGDKVKAPIEALCTGYLLTGETKYLDAAIPHIMHVARMNPDGWATREDFNRASVMLALSMGYDTAFDRLKLSERGEILKSIKTLGDYFMRQYAREFETHSMDNHVWQHTLRRLFQSSIAVLDDLPEARQWLSYCYETWCCRFPILGGNDGGWHDGNSYFQVNFETFIYMPFMLSRITGVDFFDLPYFHNLPQFLIYSFPKDSYSTGFGDGCETMDTPTKGYISFADALARETGSAQARWYADNLTGGDIDRLVSNREFTLYRLMTSRTSDHTKAVKPHGEQSHLFHDSGFALMHTDVTDATNDVMCTFMSVPFGATGHAHAAHNGFTLSVGGKQMFGGSGHYSNFNDAHTLTHYRTRGHNTILANGLSPVIGENGYGWIARYANTDALTYALGDATHAFGDMKSDFWIDRMHKSKVEYTAKNGFGNPNITLYRRHFAFLRPNIVVIYDELEAKDPVQWSWLLHSYNPMVRRNGSQTIMSENTAGNSRVDQASSGATTLTLTDEFFSPAINWKAREGDGGKALEYPKHYHAEFKTNDRSRTARFLTIIQLDLKSRNPQFVDPVVKNGTTRIGAWRISAQLDPTKPASLTIVDQSSNKIEYNTAQSKIAGSTVVSSSTSEQELLDRIPEAAKQEVITD